MAPHRHPAAALSAVAALVALSLVAAAGSSPLPAQPEAEAEPLARIENIIVSGARRDQPSASEVKIIHAASVVPALPSLSLFAGDEVITGVSVSVTLIMLEAAAEQGNRVVIGPASQVSLRGKRSVFLSLGRLLADVRGFFDLLTSRATLAAKGTEFEVRVTEEETRLTVLEGAVDVQPAAPPLARRIDRAPQPGFGLVRAMFRPDVRGVAEPDQQPQPLPGQQWSVNVKGRQAGRTRGPLTITNRCAQPHLYDVEGPEGLSWVHLFSAERIQVEGGQSRKVDIEIQVDPAGVKDGIYRGSGIVKCLDCFSEPGCAQNRDSFAVQVTVGAAGAQSVQAMEEVAIGSSGAARPIKAAEERLCAVVNWTTDVIVAGQPSYSARHVVPQFESVDERAKAFREARAAALCRGDVESYETLGHIYTDWGEGAKAVEAYTKVSSQPARQKDSAFLARFAEAQRLKGQLDEAENNTRRALAVDGDAPAALNALGNVYLDRAEADDDAQRSQDLLRRAADAYQRAAGASASAAARGVAHANIGEVHIALGGIARERQQIDAARREFASADASFKTASAAYPRYAFSRVGWGEAFRGLGEIALVQQNDSNARAAFTRAEEQYRVGLKNYPDLPDALVGLGDVYINQGRTKEAVETYARAVRARPAEPAGYYRLGVALQADNPTLAARYLDTHVKLRPAAFKNAGTTRRAAETVATLRAAPTVKVPSLAKLRPEEAQKTLSQAGLKVGTVTYRTAGDRAGLIVGQQPAPETAVARGSTVDLVIARATDSRDVGGGSGIGSGTTGGNQPRAVPDVMNRPVGDARAQLEQAGFTVKIQPKRSSRPAGTVIKQKPEARKVAKPGTEVTLDVAEADTRPVSVPDIVGDDRRRAMEKLRDKQLEVGTVTLQASCEEAGKVISQVPAEDQKVPAGTPVSFVVAGPGETPARVPRLIGLAERNAVNAIRESRLQPGKVGRRETDQQDPGTVLDQKPDPNAVLAPGCRVEMTVAVPIPLVEVPNFLKMTEADARRRLPSGLGGVFAELRLGQVTYQDAGVESRVSAQITTPIVIGQSPSAGARVRRGSEVNLVVLRPRQGGGGTQDGPRPVRVPRVVDLDLDRAKAAIGREGLRVGQVNYVGSNIKAGTVIRQSPDAGAAAQPATAVHLWVSSGPVIR